MSIFFEKDKIDYFSSFFKKNAVKFIRLNYFKLMNYLFIFTEVTEMLEGMNTLLHRNGMHKFSLRCLNEQIYL